MNDQTIAAISTPLGPGGIGIIRISGPLSYVILKKLFLRKEPQAEIIQNTASDDFTSHRFYYGNIIDPQTGNILDEALVVYMRAPKTFTREDIVEIHSHSGFVVLDRLLSAVVDTGAALAEPGEFSKRAFLNGRIDLSQAEAVIDLINAPCETAVQIANSQIEGGLKDVVEKLVTIITRVLTRFEAKIEFGDEISCEHNAIDTSVEDVADVISKLSVLIQSQKDAAIYRGGVTLSIAGVPNVGKSSLLNKLVKKETAIVSEVPGTTRDVIRDYISINGVPVTVCDTAGIHDTKNPIECIGIQKAREHFEQSDIILLVFDAARRLNSFEEQLLEDFKDNKTIAVINKNDIARENVVLEIQNKLKNKRNICVSAKTGSGIDLLKNAIFESVVLNGKKAVHESVTPNLRQRKILQQAMLELQQGAEYLKIGQPPEVFCELLAAALNTLSDICGKRGKEDLYDHIFNQFCIGK